MVRSNFAKTVARDVAAQVEQMEGDAALFQILDHLEGVESWCVVVRHIPPISSRIAKNFSCIGRCETFRPRLTSER